MSRWRAGSLFRVFRRRREDELALIDAEITAFGEELARHAGVPEGADAEVSADFGRALDAYEQAKRDFVGDRDLADAADVLRALDEGRHALACVDARLAGRPLPDRRPLCFFDVRHGASVDRVAWAPEGGASRLIDVCAADKVRLAEGMAPIATGRRREPVERRRAEPRPAPAEGAKPQEKRPPKTPAAFKTHPPELGRRHRAAGRGERELKLDWLDSPIPVVLVVRFHGYGPNQADLVRQETRQTLLRSEDRGRAVVPLPVRGDEDVHLIIATRASWSAWVQAGDSVPIIDVRYTAHGSFVLRYLGGPAHVRMEHQARGAFSLTELTPEFEQGPRVLSGNGRAVAKGDLAGPAFLHVRAKGGWQITVTPRLRHRRATTQPNGGDVAEFRK